MAIKWLDIYAGHTSGGLGTYASPWSMYEMYASSKGALLAAGDELRITGKPDNVLFETLSNTFTTKAGVSGDNYINFTGTIANNTTPTPANWETLFFPSMCDNKGLFVPTYSRSVSNYYLGSTWNATGVPVAASFSDVKRVIKTTAGALSSLNVQSTSFLRGAHGTAANPITVTSGWDTATTQNGRSLFACGYGSTWFLYSFYQCSNINVNCPDLMAINGAYQQHCYHYLTSIIDSNISWGGIANGYASSYSSNIGSNQGLALSMEQLVNGGGYMYIYSNTTGLGGTAATTISVKKLGGGYYGGIYLPNSNTSITNLTFDYYWGDFAHGYLLYAPSSPASQTLTINKMLLVSGTGSPANYKNGNIAVVFTAGIDVSKARYAYGAQIGATETNAALLNRNFDFSALSISPTVTLISFSQMYGVTRFIKDMFLPAGFAGTALSMTETAGGSVVVQKSTGFTEYMPRSTSGVVALTQETVNVHQSSPGMKFAGEGSASATAMGYKKIYIAGVAGVAMTISAWIKQTSNVGLKLSATAVKYAGGTTGTDVTATGTAAVSVATWEQISVAFTPDVDGDIELRINAASVNNGDIFYVSDITVA